MNNLLHSSHRFLLCSSYHTEQTLGLVFNIAKTKSVKTACIALIDSGDNIQRSSAAEAQLIN